MIALRQARRAAGIVLVAAAMLGGCSSFGEQDRRTLMEAKGAADRAAASAKQAQDAAAAAAKSAADAAASAAAAAERADRMSQPRSTRRK